MSLSLSRRRFLQATGVSLLGSTLVSGQPRPFTRPPKRTKPPAKKLAVVATTYYYLSHAYHICGRFLNGYSRGGQYHFPDIGIAAMYVEQQKANDLSRDLAKEHRFDLSKDIAKALTLGTGKLAVDGVLLIGEHGDYPTNERLQKLYPRYEMFQTIVEVFRNSGRVVPVFCDKHLSYDRRKAQDMVATAKSLGIPLMAGSSLPVTWRRPELELPIPSPIRQAVVVTRGEIEVFGFHGIEALQCMMERRRSQELGVRVVRCVSGDDVWELLDRRDGMWDLVEAAVARSPSRNNGDIIQNCRHFEPPPGRPTFLRGPIAFDIEYREGTRAVVLIANGHVDDTTFAADIRAKPRVSCLFHLPPPPGAAFLEALTMRVEDFMTTGKPPFPIQRTLLTSAILDGALESRFNGGKQVSLLDPDATYEPPADSGFLRGDYVPAEK
jgi:hypothetical protein